MMDSFAGHVGGVKRPVQFLPYNRTVSFFMEVFDLEIEKNPRNPRLNSKT